MTVCGKCGVELKKGAKFCKACGSGQQDAARKNDKKARVLEAEKKKGNTYLVIGIVAVAVAAGLLFAVMGRRGESGVPGSAASSSSFTTVRAENGAVAIPVSALKGSAASFFVYSSGGKDVKFFALRASDGTIRVALDACQACFRAKLGYHQQGDTMVCNNCGIAFRSVDIGVIRGGCNPIPVDNKADGNVILVKAKDLEDGAKFF
jgi:uncharacterized membrane protein